MQKKRLLKGAEHKEADRGVQGQKKATKAAAAVLKTSVQQAALKEAMEEAKVQRCSYCNKFFVRKTAFAQHVKHCAADLAEKAARSKMATLQPASVLANRSVHSASSLTVGASEDGHDSLELFLPKPVHKWHRDTPQPDVHEGWAAKGFSTGAIVLK